MKKIYIVLLLLLPLTANAKIVSNEKHEKARQFIDALNQRDLNNPAQKQLLIKQIEQYLNNINTMVADFIQIDPKGESATGRLFVSRPGKLRWQYNPPIPTLIVVNGSLLIHYDYELDQISHTSANDSMAGFLARKNINLNSDIAVKKIEKTAGTIKITLFNKDKKEEGLLTLIFTDNPLNLKKIELVDNAGQLTTITFNNLKEGLPLDDKLFVVRYPNRAK